MIVAHLQRLRVGIDNLVKPTPCKSQLHSYLVVNNHYYLFFYLSGTKDKAHGDSNRQSSSDSP